MLGVNDAVCRLQSRNGNFMVQLKANKSSFGLEIFEAECSIWTKQKSFQSQDEGSRDTIIGT